MTDKKENQLKVLTAKKESLFRRMQKLYDDSHNVHNEAILRNFRIRYGTLEQTRLDFEGVMDRINQLNLEIDSEFVPSFAALENFDELNCHIQAVTKRVLVTNKIDNAQTSRAVCSNSICT